MTIALILGITGFMLFMAYDINSFTRRSKILDTAFLCGCILIAISTVIQLYLAWKEGAFSGWGDIVMIVFGVLSFAAMIYCLFFALPFDETYVSQQNGRSVYDKGVYALCRHPGVICFALMFLFLGIAARPSALLGNGMILSGLNLLYAFFQDRVTFPKTFYNYPEYRKRVPFIIPTSKSIRLAYQTLRYPNGKEERP